MDNESVDNVNIDEDEAQNEGDNDMATNNDQEEQTVVEIFIDHVVLVVRAYARKNKIVSICKHLGS